MDPNGPGEYLTSTIHIAPSVWRPSDWVKTSGKVPAPKILAQDVKVRCIEQLLLHVPPIRQAGSALLGGPRDVFYGETVGGSNSVARQESIGLAERLLGELEQVEEEMEGAYKALVKAGVGVGAGWRGKAKKGSGDSGWRSRMARGMDKIGREKA
jgi:hypothetical protein